MTDTHKSDLDPVLSLIAEASALWLRDPTDPNILRCLIQAQIEVGKRLYAGWGEEG